MREDGGEATAAEDLERTEEVAKKFGIPEGTAAGGANVVGGGADAEVLGMAAPSLGVGLGMIGGARETAAGSEVSVGSTGFEAGSAERDRKSTRLNSSHGGISRMPSSA